MTPAANASALSSDRAVRLNEPSPTNDGARFTNGWHRRHFVLIACVALLQVVVRGESPADQDVLWGARYGLNVFASGRLPRTDTYSWTAHGRQWIPNSWGWNVVLGGAYDIFGVLGFSLLGACVAVPTALVVARGAQRVGAGPIPTIVAFVPLGLLAIDTIPRAQTVSNLPVVVIPPLVAQILFGSRRHAVQVAGLLCALQIAWMNVHSGAVLGPPLVFASGVGLLIGTRHSGIKIAEALARLGCATLLATASCLLTPYGLAPLTHLAEVRRASVGLIVEWEPAGIGSLPQILASVGVLASLGLAWRAWHGQRFASAASLVLLAIGTVSAIRVLPMLAILSVAELALSVGRLNVRPHMLRRMVTAGCVALVALIALNLRDIARLPDRTASPGLVAALPRGCNVVNDDLVGDAVILLRPDVRVSLDGRNDMYGRKLVLSSISMLANAPGTLAKMRAAHVNCVLAVDSSKLVKSLSHTAGWRIAGQDRYRTLLVRGDQR